MLWGGLGHLLRWSVCTEMPYFFSQGACGIKFQFSYYVSELDVFLMLNDKQRFSLNSIRLEAYIKWRSTCRHGGEMENTDCLHYGVQLSRSDAQSESQTVERSETPSSVKLAGAAICVSQKPSQLLLSSAVWLGDLRLLKGSLEGMEEKSLTLNGNK